MPFAQPHQTGTSTVDPDREAEYVGTNYSRVVERQRAHYSGSDLCTSR